MDVAAYMVSHINKKVDIIQHICSKLYLKRILNAVQVIPNEKVKHVRKTMMGLHNHYHHHGCPCMKLLSWLFAICKTHFDSGCLVFPLLDYV